MELPSSLDGKVAYPFYLTVSLGTLLALPPASGTIAGYEVMAMIRKGQVVRAPVNDMKAQNRFTAALFRVAA